MNLKKQIPLQEKIAELESRIVGLEQRERLSMGIHSQQVVATTAFGAHWHKMWEEFNLAMKEAFGGKS